MDESSWLMQAFVFLSAAVISVPLAKRLGLGSVLGYLIAGAVIGPHALRLVGEPDSVMHVAEFGVVIMLFLIGLEIRPSYLWRLRSAILGLGGGQVFAVSAIITGIAMLFGHRWQTGLAVGMTLSLSSTAIVLQSLRERGMASSSPGRAAFSVLLFQDIAVIPMLAVLPLLAVAAASATGDAHAGSALESLPEWMRPLAVLAAVAAVAMAARFLMRPVFRYIAKTGLVEVFTASALFLVIGVALLMQLVGLSPALGAFVAGVVLADSEFRHELESDIEPFRGLLLGLFFISVGASIDFALLRAQPFLILALVIGLLAVKALVMFVLARLFGSPKPDAILLALGLAQGGEFAFVLFSFAQSNGVLSAEISAPLIAAVVLSMASAPLLFTVAERCRGHSVTAKEQGEDGGQEEDIDDNDPHVLIAGFGRFGQIVGRLLLINGYRTSVLDYSADQVELVRSFGNQANYGDASRAQLLRAAGAASASALVIAIDDRDKAVEIAEVARKHFPHLKLLARAFDRRHAYELMKHGVDIVERETFEAALFLGVQALRTLGMAASDAECAGEIFARHDRKLLADMAPYWGDEQTYRAQLSMRTDDMEELLRRDYQTFRNRQAQRPSSAAGPGAETAVGDGVAGS